MVETQWQSFTINTGHAPRISSIGHEYLRFGDETHISRASSVLIVLLIAAVVVAEVLIDKCRDLSASDFCLDEVVHFVEGFAEGGFVEFVLEFVVEVEFGGKVLFTVLCDFWT